MAGLPKNTVLGDFRALAGSCTLLRADVRKYADGLPSALAATNATMVKANAKAKAEAEERKERVNYDFDRVLDRAKLLIPLFPPPISSADLRLLKSRVWSLDLTVTSTVFNRSLNEYFGNVMHQPFVDGDVVSTLEILEAATSISIGGDLSRDCEVYYRQFLTVKAVEAIAARRTGPSPPPVWQEKCVATKLVDFFWHAHILQVRWGLFLLEN